MDLTALLGGLAAVGITFLGKQLTSAVNGADSRLTRAYKPLQPVIAGALTFALPALCAKVGVLSSCPDAATLTQAPLGTLLGITLLEGTKRLAGRK